MTDHRLGLTVHNLPVVMDGAIAEILDALAAHDQAERLKQETEILTLRVSSIADTLDAAAARLARAGVDPARFEAEFLLGLALLGTDRGGLFLRRGDDCSIPKSPSVSKAGGSPGARARTAAAHHRRQEFHGLEFFVDRRALVPASRDGGARAMRRSRSSGREQRASPISAAGAAASR